MGDFNFLIPIIKTYGYLAVFIGVFMESMGIPLPGETVLILGGVAASLGQLDLLTVIIVAACAAVIGDNIGYFIGRKYGRAILKKLERFPLFHKKHIDRTEKFFKDHGNKTVFIGRFTAILRTYAALFAGIFDMPYPTFFFYNFSGGAIWAIIMGFLGFYIGNNIPLLEKIVKDMNIAIFAVLGLIIIAIIVLRINKKHLENLDREKPNIKNSPRQKPPGQDSK